MSMKWYRKKLLLSPLKLSMRKLSQNSTKIWESVIKRSTSLPQLSRVLSKSSIEVKKFDKSTDSNFPDFLQDSSVSIRILDTSLLELTYAEFEEVVHDSTHNKLLEVCEDSTEEIIPDIHDIDFEFKNEILAEKFVVRKSRNLADRTPNCISTKAHFDSNLKGLICGTTNKLDVSFSSSVDSTDISGLLSDVSEEDIEKPTDKSEIDFETYDYLRKRRSEQRSVIRQASKALRILRRKEHDISAILQAERGLLLSYEKCKTFTLNMTNSKFSLLPEVGEAVGEVTLTNMRFFLKSESIEDSHLICIAQCGINVIATKYAKFTKSEDNQQVIEFDDKLVFENLSKQFKIELKIYQLSIENNKKRDCTAYPTFNISSKQTVEFNALKPIFKKVGLFEIKLRNISSDESYNFSPNTPFARTAIITRRLSNFKLNARREGYINFGQLYKNNIVWNKKYLVLNESELFIYDSREDINSEPLVVINLKNIAREMVSHSCHLKYCLQLDIVHEDMSSNIVFRYPYFLRSKTMSDFNVWSDQLNNVIATLKDWNMLCFMK